MFNGRGFNEIFFDGVKEGEIRQGEELRATLTDASDLIVTLSSSDTLSVSLTEDTGVAASIPKTSDTLSVSIGDGSDLTGNFESEDSIDVLITDGSPVVGKGIFGNDSLSIALTDSSADPAVTLSHDDTLTVNIQDTVILKAMALSSAESLLLSPADGSDLTGNFESEDSIVLSLTEGAPVTTKVFFTGDAIAISLSDLSSPPSADLSRGDTLAIDLQQISEIIATLNPSSDGMSISIGAIGTLLEVVHTCADTIVLSLTEGTPVISSLFEHTESLLISLSDATDLFATLPPSADTLAVDTTEESDLLSTRESSDSILIEPDCEITGYEFNISSSDPLLILLESYNNLKNVHTIMNQPVRRIRAKVEITYTDPSLDETVLIEATGGTAYNTSTLQTSDNVTATPYKWMNLQNNVLDGTFHPMPSSDVEGSVGWWSTQFSDASGNFDPAVKLTVACQYVHPVYDLKVVGDSKLNEYPVDFEIKLYDSDDVLLHTETVTGNALINWIKTLEEVVTGVKTIELTISKWSKANATAKIVEFFTAYAEVYYDDDIVSINLLEETEPHVGTIPIGNISANEISIRLNNINNKFDPGNTNSPLYGMLKKNRRIRAWLGIDLTGEILNDENEITWYSLGTFWSQDWKVPEDDIFVETTGLDRLEFLRKTQFDRSEVYTNYSLYDLFELILQDAGVNTDYYIIDDAFDDDVIPYAWFTPKSHRTALQQIAAAGLGRVYCNRDGKIVCAKYTTPATPQFTFTWDNIFTKDHPVAWSEISNKISVVVAPRVPATLQNIVEDTEEFTVLKNSTVEKFFMYSEKPCIDIATPSITGGADISIYSTTAYSWGITVVFKNNNTLTDQTVTSVTIQGKPLIKSGEKVVTRSDSVSMSIVREQADEQIENDLIQTTAHATSIAETLLAIYKDPRQDINIDCRGHVDLKIGDRFTAPDFKDQSFNDYYLKRQELEYDGGLRADIEGLKIAE